MSKQHIRHQNITAMCVSRNIDANVNFWAPLFISLFILTTIHSKRVIANYKKESKGLKTKSDYSPINDILGSIALKIFGWNGLTRLFDFQFPARSWLYQIPVQFCCRTYDVQWTHRAQHRKSNAVFSDCLRYIIKSCADFWATPLFWPHSVSVKVK